MRMEKKNLCILAIALLTLITVSTCSTAPVKTEVIDPGISFPYFPDPFGEDGKPVPVQAGENVEVPLWYWIKITEYVIEVEKSREVYESWQKIYIKNSTGG